MRRFVSRAFLAAAVATSAACSSAGAGVDPGSDLGGRYLVMIPALEGPSGEEVANELRALVTTMSTHAAINDRAVRAAMSEHNVEELNEVFALQLAPLVDAQLISWGTVSQSGAGLEADVRFIDAASGDRIEIENVSGATPAELAASVFARFQESVEGIRQAAFCNDYLASEQFDRALTTCDAALAIVPNSTTALYAKATALLRLERDEEALRTYEQLLGIDPVHQDALLGAGFAASRLERSDEAMEFYTRYMEVNPGNVQVRMTVANDIAQTGDYVSAFRLLEGAAAENQDNTDFQTYLFNIATAAGQRAMEQADSTVARQIFTTALRAYQAAYPAGAELDASALRQAIAVHTSLGNTTDAIGLAEEATRRFPDDAQMWSQYATVLTSAGRHADAINALNRVIQINPDYENAYIRRAQANLAAGQRAQGLADLEQAAQRGGEATVAQVLYAEGARALQAENFADAVGLFEPAHRYAQDPLRGEISFYWGYSLYKQGEAIARANTQGGAAEAQRALALFQAAMPRLQASSNAQAGQVIDAAQQFIANQEAIIGAANR